MIPGRYNCSQLVAKKWPPQKNEDDLIPNIVKKFQIREICPKRHNRGFNLKYEAQRFRNIQLQEEYDTSDPMDPTLSKVDSITCARGIVFVVMQRGICYAYRQDTHQKLCILNDNVDKEIRTLFYHKRNDAVLTSSYSSVDKSIECRTISIEYIRRGRPDCGFRILESEQLEGPGYIEFDDVHQKIVTCSIEDSQNSIYYKFKVFDLNNYAPLYSILDDNILNFKIGRGFILLRFAKAKGYVHLKIISIEDGAEHSSFDLPLDRDREPNFIEIFQEKLLIKQRMKNLQILNIRNSQLSEIAHTEYMCPRRTIYLNQNQLFLTIKKNWVSAWDLQGGDVAVTNLINHILWRSDSYFDQSYITRDEDMIISYCVYSDNACSINISNILTGRCIAKITATDDSNSDCKPSKRNQVSRISSTTADALEGITALYYDEEHHKIYTANKRGTVHGWSN